AGSWTCSVGGVRATLCQGRTANADAGGCPAALPLPPVRAAAGADGAGVGPPGGTHHRADSAAVRPTPRRCDDPIPTFAPSLFLSCAQKNNRRSSHRRGTAATLV